MGDRHEPLMERFAHLLNDELAAKDMTQAEFARRTGASTKHINLVLNGRTGASLPQLDYWAYVLGYRWVIELRPTEGSETDE